MKLTEELAIAAVTIVGLGFKPKKRLVKPGKRRSKKPKVDKASIVGLWMETPLTRTLATLLEVESLLYGNASEIPHDGFKSITLDADKIVTVDVKVREKDPDALLDVIADSLERFVVKQGKGTGPVLRFWMRATGYVSQIADFAATVDDHPFTLVCRPVQGQLYDKAAQAPKKAEHGATIYTV